MASNSDIKTGQPIFGFHEPGFNHVGSYQVSCRPFATASVQVPTSGGIGTALAIEFPGVTKFIIVRNEEHDTIADAKVRLGFASGGMGDTYNYITINPSSSFSADYRINKLYVMSEDGSVQPKVSVIAGITTIKAARTPSNSWEDTVGVDKTS